MYSLKDKTFIVTDAACVLGKQITQDLVKKEKARVICLDKYM